MESNLTERVREKLDELVDEETMRKFGELNIVTDVLAEPTGSVRIRFRTLSAYSPTAVDIGRSIRDAAMSVKGVKSVQVVCGGHMMDELVDRIVNGHAMAPKRPK